MTRIKVYQTSDTLVKGTKHTHKEMLQYNVIIQSTHRVFWFSLIFKFLVKEFVFTSNVLDGKKKKKKLIPKVWIRSVLVSGLRCRNMLTSSRLERPERG